MAAFLELRQAYLATADPRFLIAAPLLYQQVLRDVPPWDPRRVAVHGEACILFRIGYEATGGASWLEGAIEAGRIALRSPAGTAADPKALSSLGNALLDEYDRSGDAAALTEAAGCFRKILRQLPSTHPEAPGQLANLAGTLLRRARDSGDDASLDEAIETYRRVLHAVRPGSDTYTNTQGNLGSALLLRLGRQPSLVTANEAAELLNAALRGLPPGHPRRSDLAAELRRLEDAQAGLGEMVLSRVPSDSASARAGGADDASADDASADNASAGDASAGDASADDKRPDVDDPGVVIEMAVSMLGAYESNGHLPLLTNAIDRLRPMLTADGPALDPALRQQARHTLGTALWSLFERTADPAAIDEAAEQLTAAAAIDGAPAQARRSSLANLSWVLRLRFGHTGRRADLERSVELSRDLVAGTPRSDPHYAGRLEGLAAGLRILADHTGDSGLVREAVEVQRSAIAAGQRVPGSSYSNLGLYLTALHQLTGDRQALDDAVTQCRRAVTETANVDPLFGRFQANLGLVLHVRYRLDAAERDLADATAAARSAFAVTPQGHPNQVHRAALLADVLWSRFAGGAEDGVLGEVIALATMAADAGPAGHQEWARVRELLGRAYLARAHSRDPGPADLASAAAMFGEIAANPDVPASQRVWAARDQSKPLLAAGDTDGALRALTLAVELVPRVARRNLLRADRERWLGQFSGLASDAAAMAIRAGRPELALPLFEQGRGILLSQALDDRADLAAVADRNPELAAELERLRDQLDPAPGMGLPEEATRAAATGGAVPLADAGLPAQRRDTLAAQWDEVIGKIRLVPGLQDFLRPPEVAELTARCADGTVAVINVTKDLGCHAIIVSADGVRIVPLPDLSYREAAARAEDFRSAVLAALVPGPAAGRVASTLGWLWDTVAAPVLAAMNVAGPPAEGTQWPRLWWLPTGPLAFLPLHAAGHRASNAASGADSDTGGATVSDTASDVAVLDRVISSYLPTVRSLLRPADRARPATDAAARPTAVVVAMPETNGQGRLTYAKAEADYLAARLAGSEILTGEQATSDAVRAALTRHAWAHFACHAVSSTQDAGAAQLLLHDHQDRPLTVRELAGLRIGRPELAFLSACDTARGPVVLADEAVHLTGTFQLAGYTHVIGTLWSIGDRVAAEVARMVYDEITTPVPDAARTARALHWAVREVRARHPDRPALWAAHIHVGP